MSTALLRQAKSELAALKPPEFDFISLGAGVQSTALSLLAIEGLITPKPRAAIFADTGWEPQEVYDHLDRLEAELVRAGIPVIRVAEGNLRSDALSPDAYVLLPAFVRRSDGSQGKIRRECTDRYKVRPIQAHVRTMLGARAVVTECDYCDGTGQREAPWRVKRGVREVGECSVCHGTRRDRRVGPVQVGRVANQWIGFSTDEVVRVKDSRVPYLRNVYPLLDLGMSRDDCTVWLTSRGWGDTPKSACVGCPFHSDAMWADLRRQGGVAWEDAVDMDDRMRRPEGFDGEVYLHRSMVPLADAEFDETDDRPVGSCSPHGCRGDDDELEIAGSL